MLRSCLATSSSILFACLALGCSEGNETMQVDDNVGADDDAPSDDDDSADDETATDDDADDSAADDDDTATDDDAEDTAADDDDDDTAGESETLIDVTTASRTYLCYASEKQFLNPPPANDTECPAPEDGNVATFTVDDAEGNPEPSLRVEVPFTNYNQFIDLEWTADLANDGVYWDLTGKVLTLQLKVEASGFTNEMCPGGVRFFIKTGETYDYGARAWLSIPEASPDWRVFEFDVELAELGSGVTSLDLTDVRSMGLAFESADCGGMFPTGEEPPDEDPPTTAVFYLDDILVSDIAAR